MTDMFVVSFNWMRNGRRYTGTYELDADRNNKLNIIDDIMSGQYSDVERVYKFNPTEKTSEDVSADIALEILAAALNDSAETPQCCVDFVEAHLGCEQLAIFESERAQIVKDWQRQTTSNRTQ